MENKLIAFIFNFVLKWNYNFNRTLIQDVLGDQAGVGTGLDGSLILEVLDAAVPVNRQKKKFCTMYYPLSKK